MKARDPLPNNRWTLVGAETVAAIGYWLGFLTSIATEILRCLVRLLRRATGDDD
jgi:hypothetical protein